MTAVGGDVHAENHHIEDDATGDHTPVRAGPKEATSLLIAVRTGERVPPERKLPELTNTLLLAKETGASVPRDVHVPKHPIPLEGPEATGEALPGLLEAPESPATFSIAKHTGVNVPIPVSTGETYSKVPFEIPIETYENTPGHR